MPSNITQKQIITPISMFPNVPLMNAPTSIFYISEQQRVNIPSESPIEKLNPPNIFENEPCNFLNDKDNFYRIPAIIPPKYKLQLKRI